MNHKLIQYTEEEVRLIIEGAIAAEREACAQLLLSTDLGGLKGDIPMQNLIANLLVNYAAAIRARGQHGD
jgi:hypothetical protein